MTPWPVEDIPDPDALFYRVPTGWLRPGEFDVQPGFFRENKGSMSVDWEKYSTAAETRTRPGSPERFAVIRMIVGMVREIDGVTVVHSPVQDVPGKPDNRAHTSIFGIETNGTGQAVLGRKERVRIEFMKRFNTWEIPPGDPCT